MELPTSRYSIEIATGVLGRLGDRCRELKLGKKIVVVSNPAIFRHYGARVMESLTVAGFQVTTCLLPPGERYKTLNSIQKIYDAGVRKSEQHLNRHNENLT